MSEFSLDNVNSMYMDVLKEIGNIGAGNATTAIAGMLGTTMNQREIAYPEKHLCRRYKNRQAYAGR